MQRIKFLLVYSETPVLQYQNKLVVPKGAITNQEKLLAERRTDMKYNQVRRGDGIIVNEERVVIHSLGLLDWNIYDCISSNHITDEVIITEEQIMHIRERHPEAYIDTIHYVREVLDDPDYIFRDKRPNTGLVVKKILNDEESSLLVLKIITSDDNKDYKNSIITSWKITEKRLNNYLRNKDIIYKKA